MSKKTILVLLSFAALICLQSYGPVPFRLLTNQGLSSL